MRGVEYCKITKREVELLYFLGENIANWIEKHKTERSELLCALAGMCAVVFTVDTPHKEDVAMQVQGIDDFCNYLKFMATKNK